MVLLFIREAGQSNVRSLPINGIQRMIQNEVINHGKYVEVIPANNPTKRFKLDKKDWKRVSMYRWRMGGDRVWTEKDGKFLELPPMLLGDISPTMVFLNDDHCDFTSTNWVKKHYFDSPSMITCHGDISTLHLNKGVNIRFNTKHTKRIEFYNWYVIKHGSKHSNKLIIKTNTQDGQIMLHRYIMEVDRGQIVRHRNKDWTDCRDCNLDVPRRNK